VGAAEGEERRKTPPSQRSSLLTVVDGAGEITVEGGEGCTVEGEGVDLLDPLDLVGQWEDVLVADPPPGLLEDPMDLLVDLDPSLDHPEWASTSLST
jgi:hypothetical protein